MRLSSRLQSRGGGSVSLPSHAPEERVIRQLFHFDFSGMAPPWGDAIFKKTHPGYFQRRCRFSSWKESTLRPGRGTHGDDDSVSRSSGFRIVLLAAPSRPRGQWLAGGFRPRLRRRVRDGISPSSLLAPKGHSRTSHTANKQSCQCAGRIFCLTNPGGDKGAPASP